jgi:hypothetical protein
MKMKYSLRVACVFCSLVLFGLEGICQSDSSEVPRRERRRSPIASAIFRGDWWDYYNRAIERFDAGDLRGAEGDLRQALKFHPDESARARTYGVRFQEYFPKAELGAILYESGRFSEAVPELMASLKSAPFEQTKFYLHESRRKVALMSPIDKGPPTVEITEPALGWVTSKSSIRIRGIGIDDIYVDKIVVGDRPLLIDRASPKVQFQADVPLSRETNQIPITIYDLLGQHQTQLVSVTVDRQGPVFSLAKIQAVAGGSRVRVQGTAYDKHVVAGVSFNGSPLPTRGANEESIDIEVPLPAGQRTVQLLMADGFGNQTSATLDPSQKVGAAPGLRTSIRVAAAAFNPQWIAALGKGPRIDLLGLQPNQRVYREEVYIDGRVSDGSGVTEVRFGGNPLDIPRGTELYFGQVAGPLKEGPNVIPIKALNANQVESGVDVTLDCKLPTHLETDQKLAVVIPAFEVLDKNPNEDLAFRLRQSFVRDLSDRGRFNIVENQNLSEVLMEREIAVLGDTRYRAADKTLIAADLVLDGHIQERNTTLSIYLNLVDVQTGKGEKYLEVHAAGKSAEALEDMVLGLAMKVEQEFPRAQGQITGIKPAIFASLSKSDGIRPGTQLIGFKEGPEQFINGKSFGKPFFSFGALVVSTVQERMSTVKPGGSMEADPEVGDIVVIR